MALRVPEDWRGLLLGRSACPRCGARLRAADLVPLLSYAALAGRCRSCQATISPYYPLVELAAAAIGALTLALLPPAQGLLAALLGWWLLALALVDLRTMLLPDELTLPLLLLGLALAGAGVWWQLPLRVPSPLDAGLGAAGGFLVMAGIGLGYERLRGRSGLGLGDAKLFAAAGAWLGWQALPTVLLLAALATLAGAVLTRASLRAETAVPFGPGLAAGFLGLHLWLVAG